MDDFTVTLDGNTIFSHAFGAGLTLAGGDLAGTVVSSGINSSNNTPAMDQVSGTVTETGNQARLDTALGGHLAAGCRSKIGAWT